MGSFVPRAREHSTSRRSLGVGAALCLAALPLVAFAPAALAVPPPCQVTDLTTNSATVYSSLQSAVTAAGSGDTLQVMGTCTGDTALSKKVNIVGKSTTATGRATLVGTGSLPVVSIASGWVVTIKSLTITGGGGGFGGGIHNTGKLTLTETTVTANNAASGGGVFNAAGATLTLDRVSISANHASQSGGGIYNLASLFMTGTTVSGNHAIQFGGGIYNPVSSPTAPSTATLSDSAITGNAANSGAGIYNNGVLNTTDVKVSKNTATNLGGGIDNTGTSTLTGLTVARNSAVSGAGVVNSGRSTIAKSTFSKNTATNLGGGIYNAGGTLALIRSTVLRNQAATGGGIDTGNESALTVSDSLIKSNTATANGGGLATGLGTVFGSTLTLLGSTIAQNSAVSSGGGVYNASLLPLTVVGSTIAGNEAATGGGIATGFEIGSGGLVTMSDSSVTSNKATANGGGIAIDLGTITTLNSKVAKNAATVDGGGVWDPTTAPVLTGVHANTPDDIS